ncbi:hypothetical protein Dimus_011764 [Dionaea muscipula]
MRRCFQLRWMVFDFEGGKSKQRGAYYYYYYIFPFAYSNSLSLGNKKCLTSSGLIFCFALSLLGCHVLVVFENINEGLSCVCVCFVCLYSQSAYGQGRKSHDVGKIGIRDNLLFNPYSWMMYSSTF